jgi:hypothetical protein
MASNDNTISDSAGEFDDWVELGNVSNDTINLFGWFISDNESNLTKHQFTDSLYIYSDSLLLLWADGEQQQGSDHLNFKLSSGGEEIFLSNPSNIIIDSVYFGQQTTDVSYGRYPNYTGSWGIMSVPTPGSMNLPHDSTEYSPDAIVLPQSGFYNSPIQVTLFSDSADVEIFFSLDGSVPDINSMHYTEPLLLVQTTVIRLITIRPGFKPSLTQTHNFFLDSDYNLPTMALAVDPSDFPIGSGEYNVHVAYFAQDGIIGFTCDAGIEKHGSDSPQNPYKISFKPEYGTTYVNYPIFENRENHIYNRLVLRNASNDRYPQGNNDNRTHLRDGIIHTIYEKIRPNAGFSAFKSIHVYINGKYWGIYNLREKQDKRYIEELFGYEDIDLLERRFDYVNNKRAIEGDWITYDSLEYFVENSDMTLEANFQYLKEKIFYEEFIDYWILEVFAGNYDWLSNNMKFWRPRSGEDKWRWLLWDVDHALGMEHNSGGVNWGDPATNYLSWSTGLEERAWGGGNNRIIRAILRNDNGRIDFINRFADLLNTKLSYTELLVVIDSLANILSPDMQYQADRWNGDLADWYSGVENIRDYALERQEHIKNHIKYKFELDSTFLVSLDIQPYNSGSIQINSIAIRSFPWTGKYFSNVPITISFTPDIGYEFDRWAETNITYHTFTIDSLEHDTTFTAVLARNSDSPLVLKVPSQYSTIKAAIDASYYGDTVLVAAGTYKENIDFEDKNIIVQSSVGFENTIIDGQESGPTVKMKEGVISGFTIMNGLGGGVNGNKNSSINNSLLKKNTSSGNIISGGKIENVVIVNNTGNNILEVFRNGLINHVTMTNNHSTTDHLISIESTGGDIKNSIIWGNTRDGGTGTIFTETMDAFKKISYSIIQGPTEYNDMGTGVKDVDPSFCDFASIVYPNLKGDYHLRPSSPAIGTGENGVNMGALGVGCEIDRLEILSKVVPDNYFLHDNYPNPFNPTTTLRFDLPNVSDVTLTIYNMLGQKVKTFNMQSTPAGYHSVTWNATNDLGEPVGAGLYLYQLQTKNFVKTRKMVLLK